MTEIAHKKSSPVEQKRRLSRSILWKLQRTYFDAQGIRAWSTGAVPHHITSDPYIADAYARVVFGFLRDCAAVSEETAAPSFPPLDRGRPVHVVELGSGPGRFAYPPALREPVRPGAGHGVQYGVSHHGLRQFEEALGWADRALELDPEFDAAKALRIRLLSTVGRPTHSS